ncbi:hypothetical protein F503_03364 [Ophiostoma piceae UAMH 11346]|uniref:Uncharacterized protein n=1 Tax=Ophiostoma piceae (strain UAMH 11346) TaxID=1262450 RepID=S3C2E0_OPHP1|nr:hypothetical protein F503_03364 [Ophiostoma piceae UAMH 11346]
MRSTTTLVSLLATVAGLPAVLAAPLPAQAAVLDVIDNRPYTPHAATPASAVLSTHRPITTTYLMGLASSTKVRVTTIVGSVLSKDAAVPIRIQNNDAKVEAVLVDSEIGAAVEAAKSIAKKIAKEAASTVGKQSMLADNDIPESLRIESMSSHRVHHSEAPCAYAQMRRDYNDMMVISLVAVFLLVIVAVELWDSSERTTDIEVAPTGAIKLAEEPASEKQPLSVQASPVILASTQTPVNTDTQKQ